MTYEEFSFPLHLDGGWGTKLQGDGRVDFSFVSFLMRERLVNLLISRAINRGFLLVYFVYHALTSKFS
jgi:hypothetical protein